MTNERLLPMLLLSVALGCRGRAPLPPKAVALNARGVEALEAGDLEAAGARFSLALEYSPRFVEALVNQALVELARGNLERARQLLERARRINPDVAQPHHALGVLEERSARPDLALHHYRRAIDVDPGFAPARANLARLLFEAGRLEHAREQYKLLVEVAPEDLTGHLGLAESLLALGRTEEADAAVAVALPRFPDAPELTLLACRASIRQGRYELAIDELRPLAGRRDEVALAALGWIAVAELARDRPRHAISAARAALMLSRDDPLATYALAMALSRIDPAQARPWLERALVMMPDHHELTQALAKGRRVPRLEL